MDKSPEKSDSQVDAAIDVIAPEKPLEKGKREAEDAIEDEVLNAKRQKLKECPVQAETKVTTSSKSGHVDSELGDTGSGLEEYTIAARKETAEIENIAAPEKKDETSDKSNSPSEFETSSDVKKTDKSSESSNSSSQDQTSLDEDIAAPNEAPTTPNAKKDESSSFEFRCDDETSMDKHVATAERAPGVLTSESLVVASKSKDESSSDVANAGEDDVTAKNSSAAVAEKKNLSNDPETPVIRKEQLTGSKTLYVGNLSFSVEQEDVELFFKAAGEVVNIRFGMNPDETFRGFGYVEFASAEAAQKALHELNGKELLRRPVKLDIAKERRPLAPYSGNDSQFIQKGGRGLGQRIYDHGFNKYDKDQKLQIGRSLVERFGSSGETTRVPILKDQDSAVKSITEPSQMGRRDQGQRIFVRGFNKFDGEDQIMNSLEEHFGSCGEITRVTIPMDQNGAVRGIALIDFKDNDALNQALKLDGSKFGGGALSVEEARPRRDSGGSGRGGGHGWRSGGWDFGGRSEGRDFGANSWRSGDVGGSCWRSRDFGGRSSWRSGGWDSSGRSGSRDFSWSKNYFSHEVDAATDPKKLLENGKREAEDAIEDEVLNAKRQKFEEVTPSANNGHVDLELSDKGSGLEGKYTTAAEKEPAEIGNIDTPKKKVETSDKSESAVTNKAYATLTTEGLDATSTTNEGLVITTKNKYESSSDVGSAGEKDVTVNNSSTAVAKKTNVSNEEPELDNPGIPKEQITGSKTLFVGNLSFSIEQEDVEHFFKAVGEVVNIRFGMNSDETFRGFGYVEFASAEAAEKALHELNGKELLRRPVRLDLLKEKRSYAPYSGNDSQFIQKGGRGQGQRIFDHGFNKFDEDQKPQNWRSMVERFGSSAEITRAPILKDQDGAVKSNDTEPSQMGRRDQGQRIFVRGFNKFGGEDQIRNSLEEHFGPCGEITRVHIPRDQDGAVRGIALIDFKDNDAFNRALKLDGSKFGGSALSVEEARPRRDIGGSNRGRGRGWVSGGGDFGGNSWRSGDCGGRSSWRSGWRDSGGRSDFRDFSWIKNYVSYEVDAATNVVSPKKPLEEGKREPEVAIEDEVLNAKRRKLEESTVQDETKVITSAKNGCVDSELGDKGSGLEECTTAAKKEPAVTAEIGNTAAPKKKNERSDESKSTSEFETSLDAVTKTLTIEGLVPAVKRTDQDQTSLDEDIAAPKEASTAPNAEKQVVCTQKKDESSSFEFRCVNETNVGLVIATKNKVESSSDIGSADEDISKKKNVSNEEPELDNPKTPVTLKEQITGSKTLYVGNLSFSVKQEDVEHFFKGAGEVVNIRFVMNSDATFRGFGYVEFASAEAAEKALHELNGKELLRRPVRLDIAKERRSYAPYSGNDNQSIQKGGRVQGQRIFDHGFNKFDEDQKLQIGRSLVERFGSSGEITRVPVLNDQDGAVKSNDTEPSQMGRRDQGQRIFVRGFNKFDGEDQIRSSLEEHFGPCGEITNVYIPKDQDGAVRGIALINFKDNDAIDQALKLDGSKFRGNTLSVEISRPRLDAGGSGRGRGRGWRSGAQDFGGRISWRSGGGDFGGRSSWSSGDYGGNSYRSRDFGGNSYRSGDFGGNSYRSGDFGGNSWRGGGWSSGGRGGSRGGSRER